MKNRIFQKCDLRKGVVVCEGIICTALWKTGIFKSVVMRGMVSDESYLSQRVPVCSVCLTKMSAGISSRVSACMRFHFFVVITFGHFVTFSSGCILMFFFTMEEKD